MAFVDIQNASLTYGGQEDGLLALQDVSLEIQRGECIAVVGPSGCGKSSLLKLVSGLHPASAGSVVVDGSLVTKPL